jgi:hypothetical protein
VVVGAVVVMAGLVAVLDGEVVAVVEGAEVVLSGVVVAVEEVVVNSGITSPGAQAAATRDNPTTVTTIRRMRSGYV